MLITHQAEKHRDRFRNPQSQRKPWPDTHQHAKSASANRIYCLLSFRTSGKSLLNQYLLNTQTHSQRIKSCRKLVTQFFCRSIKSIKSSISDKFISRHCHARPDTQADSDPTIPRMFLVDCFASFNQVTKTRTHNGLKYEQRFAFPNTHAAYTVLFCDARWLPKTAHKKGVTLNAAKNTLKPKCTMHAHNLASIYAEKSALFQLKYYRSRVHTCRTVIDCIARTHIHVLDTHRVFTLLFTWCGKSTYHFFHCRRTRDRNLQRDKSARD